MNWITHLLGKTRKARQGSRCSRGASLEPLEQRALFAASPGSYVIAFYGAGGPGGFGNDWLDNIADDSAKATSSTEHKYKETDGGRALKDMLQSIDRNHNHVISASEVKTLNINVVGYSFGGIQAVNFAASLNAVGNTIKGFRLDAGIPVRNLVTIDPVNSSPAKHTDGVTSNVNRFYSYYQRKGGETTVGVYLHSWPYTKLTSITVSDSSEIIGDSLTTNAHKSMQTRVDTGPLASETAKHKVQSLADGKLKGKDVNHGTMPFFIYDWAVQDLTR